MLSAPPAACGQTRHFNYCALVDGDVRREAARTDRLHSPHLVPATVSGIHAETQSGHPSDPTAEPSSENTGGSPAISSSYCPAPHPHTPFPKITCSVE